jgi:cell division protein FtsI/penicillin-binding protein 2
LFDARMDRIVAVLGILGGVFLGRVLWLQTAGVEEARERVATRSTRPVVLPPRRGSILDATGRVLARDAVGYDLLGDAFGLGAVEWECSGCRRVSRTYESDPGEGPADLAPLPPAPPRPCGGSCPPLGWNPAPPPDLGTLDGLLALAPGTVAAEVGEVRRRAWVEARTAAAGKDFRLARLIRRDRLGRSREIRNDVDREAALEVLLRPDLYPGLHVQARSRRLLDPALDPATRAVVGATGPLLEDDWRERREEFLAEGLTLSRAGTLLLGRSGIERTRDRELRGAFGLERRTRDLFGRTTDRRTLEEVRDGADVRLTLRADLNAAAEALLGERRGALVALDPATGAILALAGTGGLGDGDPLPAVTGLDPGSVVKVLTAAVALEGDLVPAEGEIPCRGKASKPIPCDHEHGAPGLTLALGGSCNAYFGELGRRLGPGPLADYARRLGIAAPFRVGVSAEGGGTDWTQRKYRPWQKTDGANLGIGQGPILLSPLQVAALYAAVANGGRPVTPHLVAGEGRAPGEPVLEPATIAALRAGLEATVRTGTAADAGWGGFSVAGKTGTAQIPGKRHRYNAWFAGYAPAEAPRIVVVVVLCDTPESGGQGAAPLVARFLEAWRAAGGEEGR